MWERSRSRETELFPGSSKKGKTQISNRLPSLSIVKGEELLVQAEDEKQGHLPC